jgi:hypothetical protein
VFLGVPWKAVRPKYERIVEKLKKTFPISFVIVGRDQNQDADDLLEVIKKRLQTSSYAIFDATGGNANVSLEFGFADANDIPRALYLSVHQASARASKESPIIADLAGKRQNRYTNTEALERLLRQFCQNHAYTKRFEQFLSGFSRRRTGKKRLRSLCLKIEHQLDGDGKARSDGSWSQACDYRSSAACQPHSDRPRFPLTAPRRMHCGGVADQVRSPVKSILTWAGGSVGRVAGTGIVTGTAIAISGATPSEWVAYFLRNPPSWLTGWRVRLGVLLAGLILIVVSLLANRSSQRQRAIDSLSEDLSWAIHHLLNRPVPTVPVIDSVSWPLYVLQWERDYQAWCSKVSNKLAVRAFFTRSDQLHFDRLGFVEPVHMTGHPRYDRLLSQLSLKFDRLRDVIKWAQQRSFFGRDK